MLADLRDKKHSYDGDIGSFAQKISDKNGISVRCQVVLEYSMYINI